MGLHPSMCGLHTDFFLRFGSDFREVPRMVRKSALVLE